jgi:fibrillarin-like rRNA methylase
VLYLGAASGTTVSHVSDLVGPVRLLGCGYLQIGIEVHEDAWKLSLERQ